MTLNLSLLKQPSALIPIGLSLAGLALVLGHYAMYGITHDPDEGAAAHIFQILMVLQLPVIAWFAFKWLRRDTWPALAVLALQALAIAAALASVYFLT